MSRIYFLDGISHIFYLFHAGNLEGMMGEEEHSRGIPATQVGLSKEDLPGGYVLVEGEGGIVMMKKKRFRNLRNLGWSLFILPSF